MQQAQGRTQAPRAHSANPTAAAFVPRSVLEGLWVLLVANEGQLGLSDADGRVPMMARAGDDQTYLLGFKNVFKARQFITSTSLEGAEPRMVVRGNKDEILKIAQTAGAFGVLVDYDPSTNAYAAAIEL
jgi:hypothetical protein